MEALYAKLYNKYTKLKKEKHTELEKLSEEQELKFVTCISAADELIEHLRNENDRLLMQVNDLINEVALIRSAKDEQDAEYQKLLLEENQKNQELLREIERLGQQQQKVIICTTENELPSTPSCPNVGSDIRKRKQLSRSCQKETESRKRRKHSGNEAEVAVSPNATQPQNESSKEQPSEQMEGDGIQNDSLLNINLPECCRRGLASSDCDVDYTNCVYQDLIECLVGMKLNAIARKDGMCVSAVHHLSGYSFSLKWIKNADGGRELLYRVSSLGTFEKVAPEWMRDVLRFSFTMCPAFFSRISSVIKHH